MQVNKDPQDFTENESNPSSATNAASPSPPQHETRTPIRGVRRRTAAAMVTSAFTAPHVTEFLTIDMTATKSLVDRLKTHPSFSGLKPSPLLLVVNALLWAAERTPEVNGAWDEEAQEIVVKHSVNLGVAVATPRGLVVPNIKDAQALSLHEIAVRLADLTANAREGRTPREDMTNGSITITNIGVFGIDTATPILNPGEGAILAVGAIRRAPWVIGEADEERLAIRWVTQLALSFDHRLIDGAQGSQFLADVGRVLTDPGISRALEPYL